MRDLKEIPEESPFKVPENYFEELNNRIISATVRSETPEKPEASRYRMRPIMAIAASFLILTLLGYTALRIFRPAEKIPSMPELSLQELSETILNDIDIYTLEEGVVFLASDETIPDVTDSDIIDYLILQDIDLNDIYENL